MGLAPNLTSLERSGSLEVSPFPFNLQLSDHGIADSQLARGPDVGRLQSICVGLLSSLTLVASQAKRAMLPRRLAPALSEVDRRGVPAALRVAASEECHLLALGGRGWAP